MPKMTHWNSPEPIDVPGEKAAVYAAQGWVSVDAKPAKVQPAIVRETASVDEAPAKPAKKVAAKTAAKKSSK
jgi:hypothetical protein